MPILNKKFLLYQIFEKKGILHYFKRARLTRLSLHIRTSLHTSFFFFFKEFVVIIEQTGQAFALS